MPDTNDYTVQLSAARGVRNALLFFVLTPVRPATTPQMQVFIELTLSANGTVIATTFSPGQAEIITDPAGMDRMVAKIVQSANLKPELLQKLRSALNV